MIYVIRHGEVNTNLLNQVNGWNEEKINNNGIEQAKKAGEELKNIYIDLIICSPLLRTRQTCDLINVNNSPVIYDDRLKERNSNSMVYAPVSSIDTNIWYDATKQVVYNDSEGFKSIINRVNLLLNEIEDKYKSKNVLLVTHGDICKAIYLYFNKDYMDISKYSQKIVK